MRKLALWLMILGCFFLFWLILTSPAKAQTDEVAKDTAATWIGHHHCGDVNPFDFELCWGDFPIQAVGPYGNIAGRTQWVSYGWIDEGGPLDGPESSNWQVNTDPYGRVVYCRCP